MKIALPVLFCFWILGLNSHLNAQKSIDTDSLSKTSVIISKIKLSGNKRTRPSIIFRELDLIVGDSIQAKSVDSIVLWNKQRIFNTRLFNKVEVKLVPDSGKNRTLEIGVKERWYIFPIPLISFGDRNPNEWIRQRGADIRRLNFGLNLEMKNFTGRNDELDVMVQDGFTQNYALLYTLPYANKKQKLGLAVGATYDSNKEIAYKTGRDTLVYFKSNQTMRNRLNISVSLSWRPAFFGTHLFDLDYNRNQIADTIRQLNPDYLGNGQTLQQFFSLRYAYTHDTRDVKAYARAGRVIKIETEKLGLFPGDGINMWILKTSLAEFRNLGRNFYFATLIKGKISLPVYQPYLYARGLGYLQDFVRGYEYYVADGPHFILNRNTFRKKLWGREFNLGKIIPLEQFRTIPIDIYLNAYSDFGGVFSTNYSNDNKRLLNTLLWGYGLGLDIVTYYDQVLRLEYSFNRFGESGFFFHFRKDI